MHLIRRENSKFYLWQLAVWVVDGIFFNIVVHEEFFRLDLVLKNANRVIKITELARLKKLFAKIPEAFFVTINVSGFYLFAYV